MKKGLIIFFLLFLCSSAFADKYLYLTRDSKPLKLTDGDFKLLCDNSICYIGSKEDMIKSGVGRKHNDYIIAASVVLAELNGKQDVIPPMDEYEKYCRKNIKKHENKLLLPDKLIEIDILGDCPIRYLKNVTIYRDDKINELILKTFGGERIIIVRDNMGEHRYYDLNKVPIFGRKADILILHRGIWELQNGSFIVGWIAMPWEINDGKYNIPEWWK
ncbi:MAG: hypothetical protein IKX50_05180 [Spirochaetia bacterium]|nr:hypothetical protein [Spirochaetia bacterium]